MKAGPRPLLLVIAFLAFVSLGLPDGVFGVAWPSIRSSFSLPLSQLGSLLAAGMAGYLLSSFNAGRLVNRLGLGRLLLGSSALMVASSAAYALAPAWGVMVGFALAAGLGAGAIDAGINAYAASAFSARWVNWLHACYGVGATLGPLLMTAVLSGGLAWRWGYGLIALLLAGMTLCFLFTSHLWEVKPERPAPDEGAPPPAAEPVVGAMQTLRRPLVWVGVALFFVYTGLEVAAGQWAYSLFTEGRDVAPAAAGVAVGVYWASLTAGRVAFGAAAHHVSPQSLVRLGMAVAPAAAALVWWAPVPAPGFLGLAVLGFALAPVFPLLISLTPARLGRAHAAHAIGFQVSAASLGAAAVPGLAGILARRYGLEVIGPYLFGASLCLVALHEVVLALSRRPARAGFEPLPMGQG